MMVKDIHPLPILNGVNSVYNGLRFQNRNQQDKNVWISMLQEIDAQQSARIIEAMAAAITTQQDYLSQLDSTVGDGDHGLNMAKALQEASRHVNALEDLTAETVWRTAGKAVQNSVGGASGLLFGAFFVGASRTIKGKQVLTLADIAEMLAAGLANVQKRGKAQPGDKTMVDTLIPAVTAARTAVEDNLTLHQALHRVASAANAGAEATRDMIAKQGRAKFLGERSRGYQDAGATSMAIMLRAWAETI
jgi:dihydroxyacetone kinase-like protein